MECKDNTAMQTEDCEEPTIKLEPLSLKETATGSKISHEHEKVFVKCAQIRDEDTKAGILQETWDPNVAYGINKSYYKQLSTCLGTNSIKSDDGIDIKEHNIQKEEQPQSRRLHLQQNEAYLMEDTVNSDVKTTLGIKEVAWDPIGVSSEIKCDPERPPNLVPLQFLGPSTIQCDNALDLKVGHFNQDKISLESQKLYQQQSETYFMKHNVSSDMNTKVRIKQEAWDPNEASIDIIRDPQQPPTIDFIPFLGKDTQIASDEIDIKDEVWCEETTPNSIYERKGNDSKKNQACEDVPLLESLRPYTDVALSPSATQLQEDKNSSSLSAKTHRSVQGCKTEHICKTCGKIFKVLSHLIKHNLVPKECKIRNCDKTSTYSGGLKDQLIHNNPRKHICATCGKTFSKLETFKAHLFVHDNKREYKCNICEKSFKQLSYLKKHLYLHDDRRQFQCQVCQKSFKHLWRLKEHLLVHVDKRPYKCQSCKKSFKRLHGLKSHLLVHDDKRQYKCQVCKKGFKRLPDLRSHLLVHDDKRQYKCQICEKNFNQLCVLKSHLLVHDDKRVYKCQICEKSFKRLDVLKSHLLVHDDNRKFQCHICEKTFKRLEVLKSHLLVHDDKRAYKCKICEKSFKRVDVLKSHLLIHDDKRQFQCQVCKKSFKQLRHLKEHLLLHDDKRQYECQVCKKGFKQLPDLKSHLLIHDENKQHKCHVCEKSFKQLGSLKVHLLIHDDKRQFQCEVCEKSFKRVDVLKSHLLVHDEKRQYKCQVCKKSFKRLDGLKSHLLVHDDKRQFQCEVCGKSFKRLCSLKQHLQVHDNSAVLHICPSSN